MRIRTKARTLERDVVAQSGAGETGGDDERGDVRDEHAGRTET